jgi:hypothetical protein
VRQPADGTGPVAAPLDERQQAGERGPVAATRGRQEIAG